jgi:large subunit ribosomal protein L9
MMEVILLEELKGLGARGALVNVKPGYARNYLLPQKLALPVTEASRRQIDREREKAEAKDAEERKGADALAAQIAALDVSIARRMGENNTMYGSVTTADIAHALEVKGIKVEKRKIMLHDPIKSVGEHTVPIKIHRDVVAEAKIKVVPE